MVPSAPQNRGYRQFCGVANALDLIGDRWALLVLRDLLLGPMRFSELADGLPGIGTNTLAARLRQLEEAGVIRRTLLPLPDRGTVYELTAYGRELQPILLALGRWGHKTMARLPHDSAMNSRWIAAAILGFHDESRHVERPTTWELRLTDATFTARAAGTTFSVSAGAPDRANAVITTDDLSLQALLSGQLSVDDAIASGAVVLAGSKRALRLLVNLVDFPPMDFAQTSS